MASNYCNEYALEIALFAASVLLEPRHSIREMAEPSPLLQNRQTLVHLLTAQKLCSPYEDVVHEKFVPLVEGIRCKKIARICELPVSPKRLQNAIETTRFCTQRETHQVCYSKFDKVLDLLKGLATVAEGGCSTVTE